MDEMTVMDEHHPPKVIGEVVNIYLYKYKGFYFWVRIWFGIMLNDNVIGRFFCLHLMYYTVNGKSKNKKYNQPSFLPLTPTALHSDCEIYGFVLVNQ